MIREGALVDSFAEADGVSELPDDNWGHGKLRAHDSLFRAWRRSGRFDPACSYPGPSESALDSLSRFSMATWHSASWAASLMRAPADRPAM